jgi:hypothetical protein
LVSGILRQSGDDFENSLGDSLTEMFDVTGLSSSEGDLGGDLGITEDQMTSSQMTMTFFGGVLSSSLFMFYVMRRRSGSSLNHEAVPGQEPLVGEGDREMAEMQEGNPME